ncbi:WD40 repeat domain-containing protein [Salininema proteolyticum]|uniref:WD40 repeat domain-containing protein n=1 Tax=Salininema proteolyticum TaxID=1607685 RepID=A0ABV8TWQ3_9ACTN
MAFHPEGSLLVTAHGSSLGKGAVVWNLSDYSEIAVVADNKVGPVSFTHDGSQLLTGGERAHLWNTTTWEEDAELWEDTTGIYEFLAYSVAASPVAPSVVISGGANLDDGFYFWDLNHTPDYSAGTDDLSQLQFSPDGTVLYGIGTYGSLERTVWHGTLASSLGNASMVRDPGAKPYSFYAVDVEGVIQFSISHDGNLLATSGDDGIQLWTVENSKTSTHTTILRKISGDAADLIVFSKSEPLLAGVGGIEGRTSQNDVWVINV